jgi:hypothetical protein
MWQCGNAVMMEARPCVAGLRRNTRSDCRRAATHGAPSYIAALPHSQIAALPHCLRYWIMPTPTPWMATGNTLRREPKPFDDTMFEKSLNAVL